MYATSLLSLIQASHTLAFKTSRIEIDELDGRGMLSVGHSFAFQTSRMNR